jgi:hypothetical protein
MQPYIKDVSHGVRAARKHRQAPSDTARSDLQTSLPRISSRSARARAPLLYRALDAGAGGLDDEALGLSNTVMDVVQTDSAGCSSSHLTTTGSGACCISAESTLVASRSILELLVGQDVPGMPPTAGGGSMATMHPPRMEQSVAFGTDPFDGEESPRKTRPNSAPKFDAITMRCPASQVP